MVSVREVAQRAGVSVGTVSNVLNTPDKVAEATASRVNAAIRDLGFVPNGAARQLRAGRSTSVGLIVLDVTNPFFTDLARGAEEEAGRAGVNVLLANSDERPERERTYLDLFDQQRVRGVLLSPVGDVADQIRRLRSRGVAVVLVDGTDPDFASVTVDDVAGGRMAAEHLIARGSHRLAFLGGPLAIRQVRDRLAGAERAVALAGGVSLEYVGTTSLTVLEGRAATQRLLDRPADRRPDAIFAANDLLAVGVVQAAAILRDVRMPHDLALIGYDDIDFAQSTVVPLSSIRQPSEEIGRRAMQLLVEETAPGYDRAAAPRHVVFQPELVVRASTVAPPR